MLRPRHLSRPALGGAIAVALILLAFGTLRLLPLAGVDRPDEGVPLLVFAEFGELADKVYSAPADAPERRTLIATLDHAPGWGINPAATTRDGRAVFLLAPASGNGRDTPAEVWTIDLKTGVRQRVATDADLLVQPVINRDGNVLYRRSNGPRQEIVRLDTGNASRTAVYAEETTFGMFPLGEDADGRLIITRLSTAGTDLVRVTDGRAQVIAHLSDHLARGWQIAPDGKTVVFLAPEVRNDRVVYRIHLVGLADGKARTLPETAADADQFGPTWTPDGARLAFGQDARGGAAPVVVVEGDRTRSLAAPPRGFDIPAIWSNGGVYLAVRSFDGTDATTPGNETAAILGPNGQRRAVPATGEVIFIGWAARD